MKNGLSMLFLIPACLLAFIAGIGHSPEETSPTAEAPEEIVFVTTIPTADTTAPTVESTIPEITEAHTEPTNTNPPTTVQEATEAPTEQVVTEEPTKQHYPDDGLRSLGTFRLTAYCSCQKCCGKYAIDRPLDEDGNEIVYGSLGVRLEAGVSIAVDPRVIPYGTQVVINGHTYTAHDTGGSIRGNRIDVYFDDHQKAWDFGVKYAEVFMDVNNKEETK